MYATEKQIYQIKKKYLFYILHNNSRHELPKYRNTIILTVLKLVLDSFLIINTRVQRYKVQGTRYKKKKNCQAKIIILIN